MLQKSYGAGNKTKASMPTSNRFRLNKPLTSMRHGIVPTATPRVTQYFNPFDLTGITPFTL